MRRVRAEGDRVVRIGRGRATRYALRRDVRGIGRSDIPLFRVDESGEPEPVGRLVALAGGETVWIPAGAVFSGLPSEVADMRPSGFMGRLFPGQHPDLGLPRRITDWSDDHTLLALARRGEDLPGNLILGDESMERWFRNPPLPVTRDDYPARAEAALAGEPAGSSAGGERPKFGAYANGRHVLVKFAARGDSAAERWQDLLVLEALALSTLSEGGAAAAKATVLDTPHHRFLVIERFDRIGARGRRATTTLAATGRDLSESWARTGRLLAEARLLSSEDARRLALYEAFARWIGNEDRHHHNIAVFARYPGAGETTSAEPTGYTLAPAFDQLPTLYAPTGDGRLPEQKFTRPSPTADTWEVWDQARALAETFWQRAGLDERLSTGMRDITTENLAAIKADGS